MALTASAIRAIAARKAAAPKNPLVSAPRHTRRAAPAPKPFMEKGEMRMYGLSEVTRGSKVTTFSRNGSMRSAIETLIREFDQLFGAGAWARIGHQGKVLHSDLAYSYVIEFPNAVVDSL